MATGVGCSHVVYEDDIAVDAVVVAVVDAVMVIVLVVVVVCGRWEDASDVHGDAQCAASSGYPAWTERQCMLRCPGLRKRTPQSEHGMFICVSCVVPLASEPAYEAGGRGGLSVDEASPSSSWLVVHADVGVARARSGESAACSRPQMDVDSVGLASGADSRTVLQKLRCLFSMASV